MGGFSEGSSTCSGSGRRLHRSKPLKILCDCGVEAPLVASGTPYSHGRVFYGCGLYKVYGKKQCRFFKWVDEVDGHAVEDREDKVVRALTRKIVEMRKTQGQLQMFLAIAIFALLFVLFLYVTK
ncbi:uncharacterized protein LOC130715057 [Lotus japonicus]|uniref:uncharacterized protein LOC130715057 n=1 Tax=Lotus japonicus TaxID=34305 RepID=UPI002588E2EC|nr:uncharacterized protein LOC130715057 [Lotus japonicus]